MVVYLRDIHLKQHGVLVEKVFSEIIEVQYITFFLIPLSSYSIIFKISSNIAINKLEQMVLPSLTHFSHIQT